MDEMFQRLASHFPADAVTWRVGSMTPDKSKGMALAFIDARDVMDRLDEVAGPAGWQCRYTHAEKKTVCEIDIWVEGRGWVTKSDGAGDTDVEAEKGSLSDAFKRAAVRWGIGRYLYHLPSPWVALEAKGRSYIIAPTEHDKLRALLTREAKSAAPRLDDPSASSVQVPPGFVDAARKRIADAQSRAELTGWMEANRLIVDALDDAEREEIRSTATAAYRKLPAEQKKAA